MRLTARATLLMAAVASLAGPAEGGTCPHAFVAEGQQPPAFAGITPTEPACRAYYWAWGANPSDQGTHLPALTADGSGTAIFPPLLWANSSNCSGVIGATGLLVEAQTAADGGKLAVVALAGAEARVDVVQAASTQSVAQALPRPTLLGISTGSDGFGAFVDARLAWSAPSSTTWALSDVGAVHAGYGVWVVTGSPVNTGDRTTFTRVGGTAGVQAYVINDVDTDDGLLPASQTACIVRVRPVQMYYLALSLILDGSDDPGEPQSDPSAVETNSVSACSARAETVGIIFADGFESGDTSHWSTTHP